MPSIGSSSQRTPLPPARSAPSSPSSASSGRSSASRSTSQRSHSRSTSVTRSVGVLLASARPGRRGPGRPARRRRGRAPRRPRSSAAGSAVQPASEVGMEPYDHGRPATVRRGEAPCPGGRPPPRSAWTSAAAGSRAPSSTSTAATWPTERVKYLTPNPSTPQAVADVVARLVREAGWSGELGCTFPAVIKHGVAQSAANVDKSWIGTDVDKVFTDITGLRRHRAQRRGRGRAGRGPLRRGQGRRTAWSSC